MTSPADKYCAACATPLEPREVFGAERPVCPQCGRVVFYDPKVAAVCVVARDGKVLMIRRGTDLGYGLWSLPGGFVDRGEVVESAAAREAWEETGLVVTVDGLLGLFSLPGDPVIVAAFTARETGGALAPGPEALETAFFPLDGLPELAFSRDTKILSRWKNQPPLPVATPSASHAPEATQSKSPPPEGEG